MHSQPGTVLEVGEFDALALGRGLARDVAGVSTPSNVAIGRALGFSHTTIGRARAGNPVSARLIAAVCEYFDVPFNQVFRRQAKASRRAA